MSKKEVVARDFVDKHTLELYRKDAEYPISGEITNDRVEELRELGLLQPAQKGADDLTVPELKEKLDAEGIEYSDKAKKADLVKLYEERDNQKETEQE